MCVNKISITERTSFLQINYTIAQFFNHVIQLDANSSQSFKRNAIFRKSDRIVRFYIFLFVDVLYEQ